MRVRLESIPLSFLGIAPTVREWAILACCFYVTSLILRGVALAVRARD